MLSGTDAAPVSPEESATLFAPLREFDRLVVAVSGGPDSTALLLLLDGWRRTLSPAPVLDVVTIDHGLRSGSAREAEMVEALCHRLGVPCHLRRWEDVKPATGVQEAARAARYRLLRDVGEELGTPHVVTAHTLEDQAETVLMRLIAGSSLAGLAGMAARTMRDGMVLHRPLLGVSKSRLVATCQAYGTAYACDPSNDDRRYLRPRLRHLAHLLEAEGLSAQRLARLAQRMGRAEEALDAQSVQMWESHADVGSETLSLPLDLLMMALPEIRLRLIRRAVETLSCLAVRLGGLEDLVETCLPTRGFTVADVQVRPIAGRLEFSAAPPRRSAG